MSNKTIFHGDHMKATENTPLFQTSLIFFFAIIACSKLAAHDFNGEAQYLGNAGILVTAKTKAAKINILFDPFFHRHFNTYTLVPDKVRKAIFAGEKPFNKIDAIFVSHAHGDHFSSQDVLAYLTAFPKTKLVAPKQAVDKILELAGGDKLKSRLISVELAYKEKAKRFSVGEINIDAVRIPHAGWPARANVENIVFRVRLSNDVIVMHLGDADPNRIHFQQHRKLWEDQKTDLAFPPYWFYFSEEGKDILDMQINAKNSVGIHVPTNIPKDLIKTSRDYFSNPGEVRQIK